MDHLNNQFAIGGNVNLKPSAVFNTLPDTLNEDLQQQQQQKKKSTSLKKRNTLRRTLRRVGWVKSAGQSDADEQNDSTTAGKSVKRPSFSGSGVKKIFSTMLYSFALGHKVNPQQQQQQQLSHHNPHPPPKSKPPTPPPSPNAGFKQGRGSAPSESDGTEYFDYQAADAPTIVNIDDFYLLKLIGKGNFGKVILAKHKSNQHVYAIKVISKSSVKKKTFAKNGKQISHPHDIDHVMAERNVLIRSVRHPFLIGLRWAFQTRDRLYFVTDYVNGGELFFHLQRDRRFSELRARFYAAEIVSALEYLHCTVDVVYRDLKPENILLDASGHIKLTDFGLAKEHFHRRNRGRTQTFCGTPEYLAPEILRKESYGFAVDWWCLGSVLYEMLIGLPPFYSKDMSIMYDKILNEKLRFPPYISIRARSVISGVSNLFIHAS